MSGWSKQSARTLLALLLGALLLAGCGGDSAPKTSVEELAVEDYSPQFPPDLPFEPSEWTTVSDYEQIGDTNAKRVPGSTFSIPILTFMPTLRTHGPNSNLSTTRAIHALMFEPMVQIHPETTDFIPCLATHWRIEQNPDETQTFTFRLNPKARWADGSPVTADDVYASWWHRTQEDRNDPMTRMTFHEDYEEPEILDRYTIRVKTKEMNWRLFLYFGGMPVYPAKYVKIPGEVYLKEYNWRFMPGSGPYQLAEGGLRKGESILLKRRDDWWAEQDGERWAVHTYNFDQIKYVVIRDPEMVYEKFKKGDLDWYVVGRAQRWVEEIPEEDNVNKGYIQKRKIYNEMPIGFNGLCFNMRKPPFDDKRVRLAFAHLFNRERLMDKLFFHEYEYTKSIFPGRDWGSGEERDRIHFDPDRAADLLAEAGYKNRNAEGYLVGPDGNVLEVTLMYAVQQWERIWLVVKEDFENAGIRFNLQLIDGSTLIKKVSERQFRIHWQSWLALVFPNPETSWRSDLADKHYNNNIPGFGNERVDELLKEYNGVLDRKRQKEITREIDRLVCEEVPYAFGWHSSYRRILYWDKFGHPKKYFTRIGDEADEMMMLLWWLDPEKEARLNSAMKAGTPLKQWDEVIVKPWAKEE